MATREIRQHRRPVRNIKQEQEDDSDAEEPHLGLKKSDGRETQIIHSGHFMVSTPHAEHAPKKGYDFDTVNKQTCQTYHFGKTSTSHISIDVSLTKLFECMTLAYSGKLVSPKWKNFKGLKLQWRDKIRLNNAIWRAWYIQYVERRETPVCRFETPLDGNMDPDEPRSAEATEVKYVKRRKEIVIREYHKWRAYFKKRLQRHKDDDLSNLLGGAEEQYSLFGDVFPDPFRMSLCQDEEVTSTGRRVSRRSHDSPVPMEMDPFIDMDVLMSEFSDTLFSTLASHQPIPWPNPREIAHAGNADMIQPSLIPLQPDFTDEPWQDLFHTFRHPVFPFSSSAPSASTHTPLPSSSSQPQPPLLPPMPLPSDLAPISLDHRLVSSPGLPITSALTNQSVPRDPNAAYSQNYMPLFAVQVTSAPAQPLPLAAIPPSLPCPAVSAETASLLPGAGDGAVPPPSVITHTASSVVTPSNAATTTFSQVAELLSAQIPPDPLRQTSRQPTAQRLAQRLAQNPPQAILPQTLPQPLTQNIPQNAPLPVTPPPPQGPPVPPLVSSAPPPAFVHPRPVRPARPASSKKSRPAQRIAPASPRPPPSPRPSPQLIFTAPFPGHTGAVIVTSAPVSCDAVSTTGVVLGSPNAPRGSSYHILPQTQKSPQPIVPKEETAAASTSSSKTPNAPSPSTGLEGRSSGQGSPCGLEQAASPQSPLSSTVLLKNENNQSRRVNHISAEQKRRFNINNGFKTICGLVPTLKSHPQSNISNAATLQKTVEYIGKLQQERQHMQEESRRLKEEIEELNASISLCQEQLPATGVTLTQHHFNHMREKYEEYVRNRTLQNWKFWIFSVIIKPLFESFNGSVSTKSKEELCETTLQWLDRHCALPVLRPMVLGTLRQLSTTTSIIGNPSLLPEEAKQAVTKQHSAEP